MRATRQGPEELVVGNAHGEGEGLCAQCAYRHTITSDRGSTFVLCRKSTEDPRYPRYPRLPVLRCPGFTPADHGHQT